MHTKYEHCPMYRLKVTDKDKGFGHTTDRQREQEKSPTQHNCVTMK